LLLPKAPASSIMVKQIIRRLGKLRAHNLDIETDHIHPRSRRRQNKDAARQPLCGHSTLRNIPHTVGSRVYAVMHQCKELPKEKAKEGNYGT
jgi:hypothetical protein